MRKKWDEFYKDRILSVLPISGKKVKSKEIYKNAKLSRAYVAKYLNELVASGIVEKVQESRKNVYYRYARADIRFESLIDNFMRELQTALSELPEQISANEKELKEKTGVNIDIRTILSKHERYYKSYLQGYILNTLIRKTHELLEMHFPDLRNHDYYVGVFKSGGLHILPKEFVDPFLSTES
jgi:predicted transcriptional regulator